MSGEKTSAVSSSKKTSVAEASQKEKTDWKKYWVIGLGGLLLLAAVAGGAYWFGSRRAGEAAVSPSPSPTAGSLVDQETANLAETGASPTPVSSPAAEPSSSPSPSPSPTPESKTVTLASIANLDGFRASNGGGNSSLDIRAGRNVNLIDRGFVSFDLGSLPSGATIEQATLRLYQTKVVGDAYGVGIRVMVDHLDYGGSLEKADYSVAALSSSFATLSNNASVGWKEADVTDRLRDDLSEGRSRSQYRLHMATESVGGTIQGDFASFEAADNSEGTGNTPELAVKYH